MLLTGGDTRQIDNELEKIDTFLGKDRGVHVELVRELVPLSRAGVIFELGNALSGPRSATVTDAGATFAGARRKRRSVSCWWRSFLRSAICCSQKI